MRCRVDCMDVIFLIRTFFFLVSSLSNSVSFDMLFFSTPAYPSDTQPSHVDGLLPVHQNSSLELQDSEASLTQVKLELASTEEGTLHQEHLGTEKLSYGHEMSQPIFLDVLDVERKRNDHLQGNSIITAQLESCDQQVGHENTRSSAAQNQSVQENHLDTMKLESGDWFSPYCEQISGKGFTAKACSQNFSASKSFMCDRCGSLYRSAWLLKKHLVTDHMEKPYKCDLCGKCCYHVQMLKVHLKTHSAERPFQCNVCSKTYKMKSHLKDHVRTHTGDKRYSCSACGMGFFWTNQVKVHIQNHHGGQMATVLKKSVKQTCK